MLRLLPRLSFLLLLMLVCTGAFAQATPPEEVAPDALLERARTTLDQAQRDLQRSEDTEDFIRVTDAVLAAQRDAQAASRALGPSLEAVQARLAQLGPAPEGVEEDRDIRRERSDLAREQGELDSARKRADLLVEEARQATATIERQRAQQFSARLSRRMASPLSPALWRGLAADADDNLARLDTLYRQTLNGVQTALRRGERGLLITGFIVALLLALPLRLFLRHLGRRHAATRVPVGRLRRSALALWFLLVGTLSLGLAAVVLVECLRAAGAVAPRLDPLGDVFIAVTLIAAFLSSISASLLMPETPTWRLFPLDDDIAHRLRWRCHAAAVVAWLSLMTAQVAELARTSESLTVAIDGVAALLYCALILSALAALSRTPAAVEGGEGAAEASPAPVSTRRGGVVVLVRLLGHLSVIVALLAALFGYLDFALFLAAQMIWATAVVGLVGLLMAFVDDAFAWLFHPDGRFSRALAHGLGIGSGRLEQVGVLCSAALRLLLVVGGLIALLVPYGSNLSMFSGWLDALKEGLKIGDAYVLTPARIWRALMVAGIGLWLVHVAQRWLVDTYLPKTELQAGSRSSVATVARYVGLLLVVLWTLTALGIGVEKLALVVSALSVGIGFGLQAITQNFISGLILMAERPVKIGDWVRIGDQEGDIRRINVRATEIQVGDRSTLIVPNSELVTKTVRNMTLSNPMGRVQLQFAVPLGTDVARVRDLLLEIYAAHERVQAEPAPAVFIDSINNGHVNFNSFAYVGSPRESYGVRSELFFALLAGLDAEDIALQSPQDIRIHRDHDDGEHA